MADVISNNTKIISVPRDFTWKTLNEEEKKVLGEYTGCSFWYLERPLDTGDILFFERENKYLQVIAIKYISDIPIAIFKHIKFWRI